MVEKQPEKARDLLWEKLHKHRAQIISIIAQNDWEVAYTNLLTHGIVADSLYIKSIARLKGLQENEFYQLKKSLEFEVLNFVPQRKNQTAEMVDRLREIKNSFRQEHLDRSKIAIDELNSFCMDLIRKTDKHLLFANSQ